MFSPLLLFLGLALLQKAINLSRACRQISQAHSGEETCTPTQNSAQPPTYNKLQCFEGQRQFRGLFASHRNFGTGEEL